MAVDEPTQVRSFEVLEVHSGHRIDKYLSDRLSPEYSRTYLSNLIQTAKIRVNGSKVVPSYRVMTGDRIVAQLGKTAPRSPEPQRVEITFLHEDEHIVVINKQPGLLVHPGPGTKSGTLVNGLLERFPEIEGVGLIDRPGVVHRLDRDTSGVMVAARTNAARENLVSQFKARSVHKEYRAVVVGEFNFESDYIDLPISKDPRYSDRMRVDAAQGKPSSTYYEVLERFAGFSYASVTLFTGRTHQIRVHLAHIGYPIVSDPVYGKRGTHKYQKFLETRRQDGHSVPALKRQALHAHKLRFEHPKSGETMEFEAPVPQDIQELLDALRDQASRPS